MTYPNAPWAAHLAALAIAHMDHNPMLCHELGRLCMDMMGLIDEAARGDAMAKLCSIANYWQDCVAKEGGGQTEAEMGATEWVVWVGTLERVVMN